MISRNNSSNLLQSLAPSLRERLESLAQAEGTSTDQLLVLAIAEKLARMAAEIFAMESMVLFAASIVDRDKAADVRLEAALCKLWATCSAIFGAPGVSP